MQLDPTLDSPWTALGPVSDALDPTLDSPWTALARTCTRKTVRRGHLFTAT